MSYEENLLRCIKLRTSLRQKRFSDSPEKSAEREEVTPKTERPVAVWKQSVLNAEKTICQMYEAAIVQSSQRAKSLAARVKSKDVTPSPPKTVQKIELRELAEVKEEACGCNEYNYEELPTESILANSIHDRREDAEEQLKAFERKREEVQSAGFSNHRGSYVRDATSSRRVQNQF